MTAWLGWKRLFHNSVLNCDSLVGVEALFHNSVLNSDMVLGVEVFSRFGFEL